MTLWDWLWRTDVEVVGKNAAMKKMLRRFEEEKDEAQRRNYVRQEFSEGGARHVAGMRSRHGLAGGRA